MLIKTFKNREPCGRARKRDLIDVSRALSSDARVYIIHVRAVWFWFIGKPREREREAELGKLILIDRTAMLRAMHLAKCTRE